jgi:hypothetical protein
MGVVVFAWEAAMRRIWFWAGAILVIWMCQRYSFWALFGWAYAAANMVLILVLFANKRRGLRKAVARQVSPMQMQGQESR